MSLRHLKEAWGLDYNPFPSTAIEAETSGDVPYNETVLGSDRDTFLEKLIVKAVLPPGREFGYLWSQGRKDDTGFGKTTLMRHTARELNSDFGQGISTTFELPCTVTMAGVWASMKHTGVTGIYPLLFNTIVDATKRPRPDELSLVERCWRVIVNDQDGDPQQAIWSAIRKAHQETFPGYPTLRHEILNALSSNDTEETLRRLAEITSFRRTRNGLAYFEGLFSLVRAARVQHLFVFIDQLEDLATAKNVPRATRQREVGRFRDIFAETIGFKGHCHAVFTFHTRAADALADFWHAERINPPFWPDDPIGRAATVKLKGLTMLEQVESLLATYLDSVREVPISTAEPFEASTFPILLSRSDGRIGQLLADAYGFLEAGADQQIASISSSFLESLTGDVVDDGETTASESDDEILDELWK